MSESPLQALERKIDDLISLCAELNQENAALKADAEALRAEREELADRNEGARQKVASILDRLQDTEPHQ